MDKMYEIVGAWAQFSLNNSQKVSKRFSDLVEKSDKDDLRSALCFLAGYLKVGNKKNIKDLAGMYGVKEE